MKEIKVGKNIWPDVDNNKNINKFLKRFGIELDFLLDDGLCFRYSEEKIEPFLTGDSIYFKDTYSKECILHYYENFGELVFEEEGGVKNDIFKIPILENYDI